MYSKPISFAVSFTDHEESIIGPALEKYIKKLAVRDFFMDIYTDGDVLPILGVLKRMKENYTVTLDKNEILTLIEVLRDQDKVTDECAQIIRVLTAMVDHSFYT